MHEPTPARTTAARLAAVGAALTLVVAVLATVAAPATQARTTDRPATTAAVGTQVGAAAPSAPRTPVAKKGTVVLVHGAFADASGWNEVSLRLKDEGYAVHAWANPLRGIENDAAYLRAYLETLRGPVILVGHSYGGAVISEASTGNDDVIALVFVAAYGLAQGENIATANSLGGGHSAVIENIVVRPYPGAPEGDGDAVIKPGKFRSIFAQDLPVRLTRVMSTAQRPAALSSLIVPAGEPGWETIPSYFLIAKDDHVIPPEAQRVMASRMGAKKASFTSSHVLMMSRPDSVVRFVLRADREH